MRPMAFLLFSRFYSSSGALPDKGRKIFARKITGQNFSGPSGQTLVLPVSAALLEPWKKTKKIRSTRPGIRKSDKPAGGYGQKKERRQEP